MLIGIGKSRMEELERIQKVYRARVERDNSERYSLFRAGELYMNQRREEITLRLLAQRGVITFRGRTLLEVGCGRGQRLADFQRWGAESDCIHGIDLLEPFVQQCARTFPAFHLVRASGHQLPYANDVFDLVSQSTVFSSILDRGMRVDMAREIMRVLKPGGFVVWYDFRYPSPHNADVRPVARREIFRLFHPHAVTVQSVTLLPPVARRIAKLSFSLCRLLEMLPLLRSHYVGIVQKR